MSYLERLSHVTVDPVAILAALVTVLVLVVLGAPLVRMRDGGAAVAFSAGLGIAVLLFTLLGTLAGTDFRILTIGLIAMTAVSGYFAYRSGTLGPMLRLAGLAVLAIGVLIVMVSGRVASEWDEFSHWLHAVLYLTEHHRFPGGAGAPAIHSCCAAYPYSWPIVSYLAHHISGFTESIPALVNVVLLGLYGGLLAQLSGPERERPTFAVVAVGVLAATLLAPTFVSKLVMSSYSDSITMFLVGTTAFLVYRLSVVVEDGDEGDPLTAATLVGLAGAAMINVRPGNTMIYICILLGGLVLILRGRGWRGLTWRLLLPLVLPAIAFALWRSYVADHLEGREKAFRPFAEWHLDLLPEILTSMLSVAGNKGGYFGLMLVIVFLGIRGVRRFRTPADRLAVVVAVMFVGYTISLFVGYLAVFGNYEASRAASYWRYNTHLGLAGMLVAVPVARELWDRWIADRSWARARWLAALPVLLLIVAPPAAIKSIRFDINPMKTYMRDTLRGLTDTVPKGATVAIFDPQGTGLSAVMALYEWQGALVYGGRISAFSPDRNIGFFTAKKNIDYIFVLSGQPITGFVPKEPAGFLLARNRDWQPTQRYPYPGGTFPRKYP